MVRASEGDWVLGNSASIDQKRIAYSQLVEKRKACRLCEGLGLTNPSICERGVYDFNGDIGPWTRWQGNLDADLMVIGQDWGGTEYYSEHKGLDEDINPTNKRLGDLLASIGVQIGLPERPQLGSPVFLTNSVLCLRPGRLTGAINAHTFANCSTAFLRPQVELINPRVVVTMGHIAYCSLLRAYGMRPCQRMQDAVRQIIELPTGSLLVPVYHPGNNGTRRARVRSRSWIGRLCERRWTRLQSSKAMTDEEQSAVSLGLPHAAPSGQFRVIACDTFEGPFADYFVGEFNDLQDAIRAAKGELSAMVAVYVYDDQGIVRFHEYRPSDI